MRIDLFVIDGQNDFCASGKEPTDWPWPFGGRRQGSLFVEGADVEGQNVADMIMRLKDPAQRSGHKLHKIWASLDSHHLMDCSHNVAWRMSNGDSPPPFTVVTHDDVDNDKYLPRFAVGVFDGVPMNSKQWALKYTAALEKAGRAVLCLWPVHCEIANWGSCTYHPLQMAFNDWCQTTAESIDYITKGEWRWSEHYSAMRADVPDPKRHDTQMNVHVVDAASKADKVLWTGWAGSHCLRWTAIDALTYFGTIGDKDREDAFFKKSVFFEDASASVPNIPGAPFKFTDWRQEFLDLVHKRGATITTTKQFLA